MKIALTIAGSDSCGGAGIQQDLKVFSSLGVHGASVITAITAQNTHEVRGSYFLEPKIVAEQLDALFSDLTIDAVKTGMLGNKEIAKVVYEKVRVYGVKNLVIDPVMKSTSGQQLLEKEALPVMKKLISLAKITTPNIREVEILTGMRIKSDKDIEVAARKINCPGVIITGGDRGGKDLLYYDNSFHLLESNLALREKIHGSGCAFSAAIAAHLARGYFLPDAVKKAKHFISCSLARNFSISKGKGGLRIADTGNIRRYKAFMDKEKRKVVENIARAVELFCSAENSWKLIPEVGINIAMALAGAKNLGQVAGLTGRIVRDRNQAVPVGIVNFYGSLHIGRVILTTMKFEPEKRAAMNIKFSEEVVKICRKLNLNTVTFDRDKEPPRVKTMEWGTKEVIKKFGNVPQIIYDKGGKGKEAMIRILGKDAEEVVKISLKILKEMS